MSEEQPRSVLDRVSQWLGRKKESPETTNREENGTMPEKSTTEHQEKRAATTSATTSATDAQPPSAQNGESADRKAGEAAEAAKAGRALSASARRRNQRARAKERAAREAAEAGDVTTQGPPQRAPREPGAKIEAAPAAEGATEVGTAEAKPKAKPRSGRRPAAARTKAAATPTTEATSSESVKPEEATHEPGQEKAVAKPSRAKAKPKAKPKAGPKVGPKVGQATKTAAKAAIVEDDDDDDDGALNSGKSGGYKLLINTDEPEECRLALLENGKVEGFYIESVSRAQIKGNIYKGKITSVEANLQAAFVDLGLPKNGFLSFSEIHPEYYNQEVDAEAHWKNLKIQDLIKKGQEVLVEVVKETTGNKGPSLTTYLSLPGRCLVLMPGSDSAGISRKIDDEAQRRKLREMVEGLNIPEGIGYIIRTASQEITKTSLSQDLRYLINLWEEIKKNGQTMTAPALIYKEQNIISRFLRDHYTTEIREILVDDEEAAEQVRDFLALLPAIQRKKTTVKLHQGSQPIFHQYHVEKQIEQMFQPTVPLPSGGSIVINPTEALVAIDVNSGRTSSKDRDFEESIFIANMEAAEELARQLKMRDLGGLIVVDFIDMRSAAHTREVEKKVRECMKKDKAKVDFSKISKFGLMQISRQKMAAPIQSTSYKTCPHCEGRGMIRSVENLALSHLRQIQTGMSRKQAKKVLCRLPMEVAQYILNKKRGELLELEKEYGAEIAIEIDPTMMPADNKIDFIRE